MSKPPEREKLVIEGPAGPLEALLEVPAGASPNALAVVCHPHPLHGGTMQNKVAHTLARACNDLGFAALRFNFRGVGASAGSHDNGVGEVDDARAVLTYGRQRFAGPVLLSGFSFGSLVALELARSESVAQLISIAPPVSRLAVGPDWSQPDCPWLIVQGDTDELVDADEVLTWVDALEPGPRLVVLNDVDHFFHGNLVLLRELIVSELGDKDYAK
ncbi:MAG: alpha/beta fold hydrolase [Pseudomonadota bacterium]